MSAREPYLKALRFGWLTDPFVRVQLFDGFQTTADSVCGRLPALVREAGYVEVEETRRERSVLGTLALYRAVRISDPATPPGASRGRP